MVESLKIWVEESKVEVLWEGHKISHFFLETTTYLTMSKQSGVGFFSNFFGVFSIFELFLKAKVLLPVKLGDKERFYKEQIGVKEPFPMTNFQFTS